MISVSIQTVNTSSSIEITKSLGDRSIILDQVVDGTRTYGYTVNGYIWQEFSTNYSRIEQVEVYLHKMGEPNTMVNISIVDPQNGNILRSQELNSTDISSGLTWISVNFTSFGVNSGQTYRIAISSHGGNFDINNRLSWNGLDNSPYPHIQFANYSRPDFDFMFKIWSNEIELKRVNFNGDDLDHVEGTNRALYWSVFDEDTGNYQVVLNGNIHHVGSWDNSSIAIGLTNLNVGIHTIDLIIVDTNGNHVYESVSVNVISDSFAPQIHTLTSSISYQEGSIGNSIDFTIIDHNPNFYNISRDENLIMSNIPYSNGTLISINIDGLPHGSYEFKIKATDQFLNVGDHSIFLTVTAQDTTSPTISTIPTSGQYSYIVGSTGNYIGFEIYDDNMYSYDSFVDNVATGFNVPFTGGTLSYLVDGLDIGAHNVTIIATDTYGNTNNATMFVDVLPSTPNDSDPPIVIATDVFTTIEGTMQSYNFTIMEENPGSYNITVDGYLEILNKSFSNGTQYPFWLSNIPSGNHSVFIEVIDYYGNYRNFTGIIQVLPNMDTDRPDLDRPYIHLLSQELLGQTQNFTSGSINILWNISDTNPDLLTIEVNGTTMLQQNYTNGLFEYEFQFPSPGRFNITLSLSDDEGNSNYYSIIIVVNDDRSDTSSSQPDTSDNSSPTTSQSSTTDIDTTGRETEIELNYSFPFAIIGLSSIVLLIRKNKP